MRRQLDTDRLTEIIETVTLMELDNCYRGDGVLCSCGLSEARYRKLLELCGVPCEIDHADGPKKCYG